MRRHVQARRRYMRLLRRTATARQRMIAGNRRRRARNRSRFNAAWQRKLVQRMPAGYRRWMEELARLPGGRVALARHRKFWGVPFPPRIVKLADGQKGTRLLVGLGVSPKVVLADKRGGKPRFIKGQRMLALDMRSKRLVILNPRRKGRLGRGLRFVGFAPETHYVPSRATEHAGSFKRGKYWVHKHDDDGGKWPKVYQDSAGNFVYGRGTYSVGAWLRK